MFRSPFSQVKKKMRGSWNLTKLAGGVFSVAFARLARPGQWPAARPSNSGRFAELVHNLSMHALTCLTLSEPQSLTGDA